MKTKIKWHTNKESLSNIIKKKVLVDFENDIYKILTWLPKIITFIGDDKKLYAKLENIVR